jgi:hypothetical protein
MFSTQQMQSTNSVLLTHDEVSMQGPVPLVASVVSALVSIKATTLQGCCMIAHSCCDTSASAAAGLLRQPSGVQQQKKCGPAAGQGLRA